MGSRALFNINDSRQTGHYWLHWGSPTYQIPNLAKFIHHCRTHDTPPTVEAFERYARAFTDGQLPTEKVPADCWTNRNSTDAENRYHLSLGTGQPVRLHAEILQWTPGPPQWHTVCQTTGDDQLYLAAADARDQMATHIRRQLSRNPGLASGSRPLLPDIAEVLAEAATFRQWATAATTTETAANQPPT